jgi:pilus assembly protein CpaB
MFGGRTTGLIGLSLVLALCAVWLANRWLQNTAKPVAGSAVVRIAVASREIPFGAKIEESQVKLLDWPKANLPTEYFSDTKQVIGEVSTQTIYPGDVFNKLRIRTHLGGSPLSALIEPNMRAVSVRVNDVVGVSGFLLPGNRVDVLSTYKPTGVAKEAATETLLEDVKVLAVDQEASPEKNKPVVVRSVTLEVHPEQAELLAKATGEGSIQLSLRNPLDHQIRAPKPLPPKIAPPPAPPKPVVIKVIEKPAVPATTAITLIKGTQSQVLQCTAAKCN